MSAFTCDWPVNGRACGKPATFYIDQGASHRPICADCAALSLVGNSPIEEVDPEKVPRKTMTQAEQAMAEGKSWPPAARSIFSPPPPAPDPKPSRPPLKEAVADLGAALLVMARERLENWRRK